MMAVTMIPSTWSIPFFNALACIGAGTGGAIKAHRDSSSLQAASDNAALGYQREPMAAHSEFHTPAHTGTFLITGDNS